MSGPAELSIPEHRRFALNPECISCTSPEDDPSTFAVSRHWKIVLHPDQTVPGAVLVVSLRHAPKLSDLTEAESADWHVAPRYDHSLTVLDRQFTDPDFGEELHWRSRAISPAIQAELTRRLQQELGLR